MTLDEIFVGSLAVFFSLIGFSIGVGPWNAPYQLRTFQRVTQRYGKSKARVLWILISLVFLALGLSVLLGLRPSYASPSAERHGLERLFRYPEPASNIAVRTPAYSLNWR